MQEHGKKDWAAKHVGDTCEDRVALKKQKHKTI